LEKFGFNEDEEDMYFGYIPEDMNDINILEEYPRLFFVSELTPIYTTRFTKSIMYFL
jgi:hypothetical protein